MRKLMTLLSVGFLTSCAMSIMVAPADAQSLFNARVSGKGKPIIFIPGLYCTDAVWTETVEHYKKGYECHVLTLAGFGGQPPLLRENFLEAVKQEILTYIKERNLQKPVIIGHSLGSFLALWTASSAPGLLSGVIGVDGIPFVAAVMDPKATAESAKVMANAAKKGIENITPEQALASQKKNLRMMITDPRKADQLAVITSRSDSKTQGQVLYEYFTTDIRKELSAIDCPVLYLGAWAGSKNYGVTREATLKTCQEQLAAIKNLQIEINDTALHFIFIDDPQWFFEKADPFLK